MRIMFKDFKKDFMYTWEHKKAVLQVERDILGRNTLQGYMHDMDKLFLYVLFTKKETSRIHRMYSRHHTGNHKSDFDVIHALIDWESARITKPDKQETAREYLFKYIPEHAETYLPFMEIMNI